MFISTSFCTEVNLISRYHFDFKMVRVANNTVFCRLDFVYNGINKKICFCYFVSIIWQNLTAIVRKSISKSRFSWILRVGFADYLIGFPTEGHTRFAGKLIILQIGLYIIYFFERVSMTSSNFWVAHHLHCLLTWRLLKFKQILAKSYFKLQICNNQKSRVDFSNTTILKYWQNLF